MEQFLHPRVLLPVIHVVSLEQALRNVHVAFESGADGVFLISHKPDIDSVTLLEMYNTIREAYPDPWIGVNFLGARPNEVFRRIPLSLSGVWSDNAMISEWREEQPRAERIKAARPKDWNGLYFGGVAFKYQRPVKDYETAAQLAVPYVDVITTSGPKTGLAPDLEKLSALRRGAGDHPLAVASGVTVNNVAGMLPLVDAFLVATGISVSWTDLDPSLTRELADQIHSWSSH